MCAELKEILRKRIKNAFIMMEFVEPIVSFFLKGFKNKCKSNLYKPI